MPLPSGFAVQQALIVGLIIPLFSSIVPIQSALSKNLNEALDTTRSKSQSSYVEIIDPSKQSLTSYIVFGLIATLYGMSIYYFLPYAMLSFNFALVLQIFFFILVGMLFGLSLLAFNLQRFLELVLTHVFLFFEKSSMKQMILKNLTAHKIRNKMTAIIYSIALGFIIFLIVSYQLQLKSTKLTELLKTGTYFELKADNQALITRETIDPVLQKYSNYIEGFAYVTPDLKNDPEAHILKLESSDKARIDKDDVGIYGIQPGMFEATVNDFLVLEYQSNSSLPIAEQLYSAKGS